MEIHRLISLQAKIGTLRYPGRGLGGCQPEVNSQGLESNLYTSCHLMASTSVAAVVVAVSRM